MSWNEFCGNAVSVCGNNTGTATSDRPAPFTGVGANTAAQRNTNPGFQYIATTGSMLVLNFAEVIQLTEEYYAPGSLGTFNLQLSRPSSTTSTRTGPRGPTSW